MLHVEVLMHALKRSGSLGCVCVCVHAELLMHMLKRLGSPGTTLLKFYMCLCVCVCVRVCVQV